MRADMKRLAFIGVSAATAALLVGCSPDVTTEQQKAEPTTAEKKPAVQKVKVEGTPSATPSPTPTCRVTLFRGSRVPEDKKNCEIHWRPQPKWLTVVDVIDGDTIKVNRNFKTETVRFIGIDTPETVDPRQDVECFGPEASKQAHKLLDGTKVRLELDPSQGERDKFGRLLAYVWLRDGRLFNEVMIRGGYAEEYTYDEPYKYRDRFVAAERQAKAEGAGMWTACAKPKPKPQPVEPEPVFEPKPATDPRFGTCREAIAAGYGPYVIGEDEEYYWYRDADSDGVVCET